MFAIVALQVRCKTLSCDLPLFETLFYIHTDLDIKLYEKRF